VWPSSPALPYFSQEVKKCEILPRFSTTLAFHALWFENEAKNQKSKTIALAPMSGHSSAADPVQLGPKKLWDPFAQLGPIKCDNWKDGYIALTQPHVDRLRSNFTRWYSVAPGKLRNCKNLLRIESKMADDDQTFNIRTPLSSERLKLETPSLVCASTTRSNFDDMQKPGQQKRDLV